MRTVLEIVDAVKELTAGELAELFVRLRESGIRPPVEETSNDFSRYASEEFTRELTECFHHAKRRALDAE